MLRGCKMVWIVVWVYYNTQASIRSLESCRLDVDVLKLIIEGSQRLPVEGSVCVVHHSIVQYLHRSSDFYLTEAMDRWTSITSTITSKRFEYLIWNGCIAEIYLIDLCISLNTKQFRHVMSSLVYKEPNETIPYLSTPDFASNASSSLTIVDRVRSTLLSTEAILNVWCIHCNTSGVASIGTTSFNSRW